MEFIKLKSFNIKIVRISYIGTAEEKMQRRSSQFKTQLMLLWKKKT